MQELSQQRTLSSGQVRTPVKRMVWAVFGLWLFVRVLMSIGAALISPMRPLTEREQSVALWPPVAPWSTWLERVVLAPWERWDTRYYLSIVQQGYRLDDGTAQFHPLLP